MLNLHIAIPLFITLANRLKYDCLIILRLHSFHEDKEQSDDKKTSFLTTFIVYTKLFKMPNAGFIQQVFPFPVWPSNYFSNEPCTWCATSKLQFTTSMSRWNSSIHSYPFLDLGAVHVPCYGISSTRHGRHFTAAILSAFIRIPLKFKQNFTEIYCLGSMTALAHMMAWRPTGDKPLSETMLVCCTDAFMSHSASMS